MRIYLAQSDDEQSDDDMHGCWDIEGQPPGHKSVMVLGQPIDNVRHDNLNDTTTCTTCRPSQATLTSESLTGLEQSPGFIECAVI